MARTIDNLGIEISTRYAEDKAQLDEKILREARSIPIQTQIDVTLPSYASEFDLLFDLGKRHITWANFFAPSKYYEQKKRLFTEQIIPAIGSQDKKELQMEKIKKMRKPQKLTEEERMQWEEEKEKEEEEKQRKILLRLMDYLASYDNYLIDINSRRSQYQKG